MSIRILQNLYRFSSVAVLICVCGCGDSPARSENLRKPNVLLVTIDTCRADRIGSYGYGLAQTPALDALSAQGLRCTDAISAAPITLPSHASILTGLFPPAHGIRDNGAYALSEEAVTLAEVLAAEGYSTQAFVSAQVLNRRYNLGQGFAGYDDDLWGEDRPPMFMIRDRPAQKTAQRVVAWLDEWDRSQGDSPFFLWVHLFDPHHPHESRAKKRFLSPTSYDAEIAQADEGIATIVDWLTAREYLDDTLITVTADHGESLGEHEEKTHAIFVYDATVRVPLIWRYPRFFPKARVYDGPVRTVDIMPTILSIVGATSIPSMQGVDLTQAFRGKTAAPSLPQYSESLLSEVGFGMAPLYAVRLDGYKYIRAPRPELYRLADDPKELENRYHTNQSRARELDILLDEILTRSEEIALSVVENPMDTETLEMLEALGYLSDPTDRSEMKGMDPKDGIKLHNVLEQARNAARRGNWARTEEVLLGLLETVPGHVSALNVLALAYHHMGKQDESTRTYLRSLEIEPLQHRVLHTLGMHALNRKDHQAAARFFERSLKLTPRFLEGMVHLAYTRDLQGDADEYRRWVQLARTESPDSPRVELGLAGLHFADERYERALTHYLAVLKQSPGHFTAQVQSAICEKRLGRLEHAIDRLERAAQINAESWVPEYNLACIYAMQANSAQSLAHLEASRDRIPDRRRGYFTNLANADPDLASVRRLPEFARLLATLSR